MANETITYAELEEHLAIHCCHITGSHNPTHLGEYVCLVQKAEAYDRLIAKLELKPKGLEDLSTFVSEPGCYWCRLAKEDEVAN